MLIPRRTAGLDITEHRDEDLVLRRDLEPTAEFLR